MKRTAAISGFTLVELVISIAVSAIIMVAVYNFFVYGMNAYQQSFSRAQSGEQARTALDRIVSVMREAQPGENGAYPVVEATSSSFTFYADVDNDGIIEQVRYYLNGTALDRTITEPSGTPPQYLPADAVSDLVVPNIRALQFDYFDKNYTGTQAALTTPIANQSVRLVKITVTVDDNPMNSPTPIVLTTSVMLRNLKDNL